MSDTLVVYDRSTWQGFLLPTIAPNARRLEARIGEDPPRILRRLGATTPSTFVFHVDLTDSSRCPFGRSRLTNALTLRGWRVLNPAFTDVSKRFVQKVCRRAHLNVTAAGEAGDPNEVVIMKTNRNYGGKPEAALAPSTRARLRIAAEPVRDSPDHGYIVCTRKQVPAAVWKSPAFVVERYVENSRNFFYRAYLLDGHVALSEGEDPALVKTIGRAKRHRLVLFSFSVRRGVMGEVPPDLAGAADAVSRFAAAARMDYGCLDVLWDGAGGFYIVDITTTPHWGREDEWRILSFMSDKWPTTFRAVAP
jgi:hypothetical protein